MIKNKELLIGAHLSIAGGLHKAIERAEQIGAHAVQVFTKNNRSYFGKQLCHDDCIQFNKARAASSVRYVVVHSSYLINIGACKKEVEKKSVASLIHELERCQQLGIDHLVLHPGSHTGAGVEACIHRIASNIDHALCSVPGKTMILLETAAGQGTNVGFTFEHIRAIYDLCSQKHRVGVCFDTCHVFAAGYDISTSTGYKKTWAHFAETIGMNTLKLIHLNDSKMPCGSKKDRHENLGKGTIPLSTFELLINDPALQAIPKILETPSDDDITIYKKEIILLKEMYKAPSV